MPTERCEVMKRKQMDLLDLCGSETICVAITLCSREAAEVAWMGERRVCWRIDALDSFRQV